ncbi:E3 SUMO-protein ligase ZBED1-like [Aphis gossypii]|uniref:E3 SUMO-protein ligase ZBED1-like n=1 Tax=Aphis gossypii TaxID=80765 RepID=UPI0021599D2F|nr:E3 SUMO-protein ligase ZBED1-like [Aphis gossypii]
MSTSSLNTPSSSNAFTIMQASTSIPKKIQTSVIGYLPKKLSVDAKKKLDQTLLKLFVNDFQPFKVVEDSGFKQFVKILNPNNELPNCHTISKELIPAMYEKCLGEIKSLSLTSTVESACLTTDCWTSRNNESFMAITIHFIDTELELKSMFKRIFESWELTKKNTFAVSDNAYNIKNALNNLGLKNMGCFAHTMYLIVQSALTLEEDLINKTKNIVSHFKKSTVANNSFKTYQLNNGIKNPKKLIQDVSIRWNSTFYMVCRFVELETFLFRGTLGLLNNAPENLRPEEWSILKDLIKVLKPFEESTEAISGQKYITASLVIVIVQRLFKVYNSLRKTNLAPRVLHVVDKLIANMNERDGFKNLEKSKTLSRCTFLDPRFKHIPFNHNDTLLNTTKNDLIEKTANIVCSKYTEEYESVSLADVNNLT